MRDPFLGVPLLKGCGILGFRPSFVDRIWLWVHYNEIPIYPIFYLLEGDCICVSPLEWKLSHCLVGRSALNKERFLTRLNPPAKLLPGGFCVHHWLHLLHWKLACSKVGTFSEINGHLEFSVTLP